jgi:uncharacterized protein YuzB (UPF0349 family)
MNQTSVRNYGCLPTCDVEATNPCGENATCQALTGGGGACVTNASDCPAGEIDVVDYGCLPTCDLDATNPCGNNATCQALTGGGGACVPDE